MFVVQVEKIWIPDIEILNLKEFKQLAVLAKLQGLWLNRYTYSTCLSV